MRSGVLAQEICLKDEKLKWVLFLEATVPKDIKTEIVCKRRGIIMFDKPEKDVSPNSDTSKIRGQSINIY